MLLLAATLIVATLVSEDAACLAAGALIARGGVSAPLAIGACSFGIFAGDMGLWALGRAGGRILASRWFHRRIPAKRLDEARLWLDRHSGRAIVLSRFTPGARLPMYVVAGLLRISPLRFGAWTLCASLLWTPIVILAAAQAADAAGQLVVAVLAVAAVAALLGRPVVKRISKLLPPQLHVRLLRLTRWEFWPGWLFYAPVAAWVAALAVRYRSLTILTACNPGIEDGGFVGESKFEILQRLPREVTIPAVRLSHRTGTHEPEFARAAMRRNGWSWPMVIKPDVGQRGTGVRLIRDATQLAQYLAASSGDLLLQPCHAGPYEAGIFYYRFPDQPHGRIFSITDKQFPVITGDGRSTIAELVAAHPRHYLQAALFLRRHYALRERVLAEGERFQLAFAGNHAQGTLFRDGRHLLTPALERRVDDIARQIPGFFIGRFDVRYRSVEGFKAGKDLAIVELNGATAESTNIYDPDGSLLDAYRTLFRQWSLVFAIGAANRRRGAVPTPASRLVRLAVSHLTSKAALAISD
jgi:membrane protein DedA with SNARE-associated domain